MSCALGQLWTSIKFKIQLQPMQRLKPENAMHIIINQLGTEDFNSLTWWATLPCLWPLRKVYTSYKAELPRVRNKIHSGLSGYRMPFFFTRGRITPANLQLWNPNPQGKKEGFLILPSTHDWELSSRLVGRRLSYWKGGIYTFHSTFKPDFYCNWNKAPCSRFSTKACCSLNPEPAYTNGDNEAFPTTTKAAWQLLTKIPHPSDGPDSFLPATWSDSWSWGRKLAVGTPQRQCWWQLAAYCRAEPRRSPPAQSGSVHCRPVPHAPPAQRHGFPSLKKILRNRHRNRSRGWRCISSSSSRRRKFKPVPLFVAMAAKSSTTAATGAWRRRRRQSRASFANWSYSWMKSIIGYILNNFIYSYHNIIVGNPKIHNYQNFKNEFILK